MVRPHGVPVLDALGVVPHPVAVDEVRTRVGGDPEHAAVHMGGDAGQQVRRGRAEAFRPGGTHQVVIPSDAAARHDHGRRPQLELSDLVAVAGRAALSSVVGQDGAPHAGHPALLDDQSVDAVTVKHGDAPARRALVQPCDERFQHARPGSPGDVESRDGVPVAARARAAPLRPSDDGEEPDALLVQPRALLTGREVKVGLGPPARPAILVAVERRTAEPVLTRQCERVVDAHPALLGGVDQEQTAERPPGLASQRCSRFLLDDRHALAGIQQLTRGDESRKARSDHDGVRLRGWCRHPGVSFGTQRSRSVSQADARLSRRRCSPWRGRPAPDTTRGSRPAAAAAGVRRRPAACGRASGRVRQGSP